MTPAYIPAGSTWVMDPFGPSHTDRITREEAARAAGAEVFRAALDDDTAARLLAEYRRSRRDHPASRGDGEEG